MKRWTIAAGIILVAGSAATADWHKFDGKPAPEISAADWLHVDGPTPSLETLKGKVWLLNFIGLH